MPNTVHLPSTVILSTIPVEASIRAIQQKFSSAILASDYYIYLVPCRANTFMRIVLQTNTLSRAPGHETFGSSGWRCTYSAAIQADHKIYFIPTSKSKIYVIDPQNLCWLADSIQNAVHGSEGLYAGGVYATNGLIYMVPSFFLHDNKPSITAICPAVWTQIYTQCARCPPNSAALGPTGWRCACDVQHKPQYVYKCAEPGCGDASFGNTRCQTCLASQYRFMDQCVLCENGFQLNAQKTGCDQSPCVAGQFRNLYTSRCQYCPPGYYMSSNSAGNEHTQDNCQKCASGKYMRVRETWTG